MDVLLQTHGAKRIFPIPEGLKELSSDIVREVLRHQPECIHLFVAEYLETMLIVREKARDSAVVVSDIFRQGYFLDDLYKTKRVNREGAEAYATRIQASWRGYVVRRKLRIYLQKRKKIQEEREKKKTMKVEEYLDSIGITYDEATRAACIIQAAYRQARRGKWVINEEGEEVCVEGEMMPIGQRIREGDRAQGRYDRWDKKDWGDFFQMDENGEILHEWPKVGQLFKIPRDHVTPDMEIVQFFAMRDDDGKEQYSYMKGPQKGRDPRGFPIGFLIPLQRDTIQDSSPEVAFVNASNNERMGPYVYIYERRVEMQDLNQFAEVLTDRKILDARFKTYPMEVQGEFDYDPQWVLPRVLIQIRKDCLKETDYEVLFLNEGTSPTTDDRYTFRAESADGSLKVINHVQKSQCGTVEEAVADAGNASEYKQRSTGRFLAVEDFSSPKYIQKVVIQRESKKAAQENKDMDLFEYVFVPKGYKWRGRRPKLENPIKISLTRFQGHRSYYLGSKALDNNKIFIMGPMLHSPDGKPLTQQAIFWEEFGPESWYQLLCNIATKKIARLGEAAPEEVEEEGEEEVEEEQDSEDEAEETEASIEQASQREVEIHEPENTEVPKEEAAEGTEEKTEEPAAQVEQIPAPVVDEPQPDVSEPEEAVVQYEQSTEEPAEPTEPQQ